ncbi:DHA2 family efflux MFS transporter permease subunit [Niallia sp. XMNu-256]|uniref:DHA2 family efflux MFS transporter permease subunit n=1 Tax=Niallia sp. XMNu-256 TaxID=3082444 RepID=UPI0030CCBFD4
MEQSIKKTNRPPYGVISILMIGAFISFLNNTLMNVALPSIMRDLNVGPSTVQWLTTGFMLVSGILIPTTAYLIQKYSVRHLFLVAIGMFTVGTILSGIAPTFSVLLAGRLLQAAGTAVLSPLLMNVMLVSFPIEKRGSVMGIFGLILMFAPAIGPTLSGWIVEHYNWRMLFYFVAPIAILVFLIGFFLLKDKKDKVEMKLDVVSLILSSLGFGGILYGFSSAGNAGWDSPIVYGTIIIGLICLTTFILRQFKSEEPLLNFNVYQYPMFVLSSVISMVVNMALFSGMILLPIYVQDIRGISPMDAGLLMLPGAILMAFMSPLTGRLFDKFGGRALAITGLTITVVTTFAFSQLRLDTPYMYLLLIYSVRSIGMSMVFMPVSTNGLNQLPRSLYPHGTAMNNTLNQVAGAIGTALMVTIMTTYSASRAKELGATVMQNLTAQPSEAALAQIQEQVMTQATLDGINFSFLFATGISFVALVLAFFIKRATPMEEKPAKVNVVKKVATGH